MITEEKMTTCKNCQSELCYETSIGEIKIWICITCGFTTNSNLVKNSPFYEAQYEKLPEIYKELSIVDDENKFWIPNYIHEPGRGFVYLEGTNREDIKWVGVKDTPIKEEEIKKYPPKTTHKPDISTKKEFSINSYIEAVYYIFGNK